MLRGGDDRLWSMTLMMIAVTGVTAIAAPFVSWPNAASWPYVFASALIHVGYNLSLVRTYRSGDLGQTYPISRGSSPVLVALGALAFAHESLSVLSSIGIALVSGGILSLAFQGESPRADFLPAAFVTAVLIGAYTVIDGIGRPPFGEQPRLHKQYVPAVERHDALHLLGAAWEAAGLRENADCDGAVRRHCLDSRLRDRHLGYAIRRDGRRLCATGNKRRLGDDHRAYFSQREADCSPHGVLPCDRSRCSLFGSLTRNLFVDPRGRVGSLRVSLCSLPPRSALRRPRRASLARAP